MSGSHPQASTGLVTLPEQIGRYRLIAEIGRGSMGQVFVAHDPNIERRVALKVLLPSAAANLIDDGREGQHDFQKRFVIEARAAGRLSHPGIVAIYDAAIDPKSHLAFIAMELVDGASVAELLLRLGPLDPTLCAEIGTQVARALDFAHSQGVVHRDIKPENLLVARSGQVKILDFGVAKLATESHTVGGEVLGTPAYMSPEQVRGLPLDGRSDLFSLGAVLYQCLTGSSPFYAESVATIVHKILHVEALPIGDAAIPPDLWRIVSQLLAKETEERPGSGLELARALETSNPRDDDPSAGLGALFTSAEADSSIEFSNFEPSRAVEDVGNATMGTLMFTPSATEIGDDELFSGPSPSNGFLRRGLGIMLRHGSWIVSVLCLVVLLLFLWSPNRGLERPVSESEAVETVAEGSRPPGDPITSEASRSVSTADPEATVQLLVEPTDVEAPAVGSANLVLLHENRLANALISLWIDGERIESERMRITGGFLARSRGAALQTTIPVTPGWHSIEVRITGAKGRVDSAARTEASFEAGETRLLRVRLLPVVRKLRLAWKE